MFNPPSGNPCFPNYPQPTFPSGPRDPGFPSYPPPQLPNRPSNPNYPRPL